jgi:hypothetical protein
MANKKEEKSFDAVKMMRDIRDKISAETQGMSFDELKKYIDGVYLRISCIILPNRNWRASWAQW